MIVVDEFSILNMFFCDVIMVFYNFLVTLMIHKLAQENLNFQDIYYVQLIYHYLSRYFDDYLNIDIFEVKFLFLMEYLILI